MVSPCEVCICYIGKCNCYKRGKITKNIWDGTKECPEYNDGVDTTLAGYKTCVANGGKILDSKDNTGLFTI